jgi:hypothetical protein
MTKNHVPCDDCSSFDFSCTGKCKALDQLIEKSRKIVDAMTPEEKTEMFHKQAEDLARAEASWPKAKFKMVDGVKVYDSYEDYYND